MARRLREAAAVPTELARGPVQVGVSVGIAFADSPLEAFDALLARADRALYEAKSSIGRIAVAPTSPGPDRTPDDDADARLHEAVQALSEAVAALPLSGDHDQRDWVNREVALHCIHRALLVVRDLDAFAPAGGSAPVRPPRASTRRPRADRAPEPSADGA